MNQRLNLRDHLSKKKVEKKSNTVKELQKTFEIEHLQFCKELKDMGIVQDLFLRHFPNTKSFLEKEVELLKFYHIFDDLQNLINESKERKTNPPDNP